MIGFMNPQSFAQHLDRLLRRPLRVLLTMTAGPDGDSLGSMLAMAHAVRHYQRDYTCYSPDPIPAMFEYLLGEHKIMRELADTIHDYSLVMIFDTGDVKRTPLINDIVNRDPKKTTVVNIDHHPTIIEHEGRSAVDLNVVDTGAAATTEVLYKILSAMDVPFTHHLVNSLLTGILTDTGHFANQSTTVESLEIAAALMAKGADHQAITAATMRNKSLGTLQLWGRALSRLNINRATGVVSTAVTLKDIADCGANHDDTTGIANFLNTLNEGKVVLVLQEMPGGIVKGSFRTTADIDVAELAKQFGGGGHAKAAGFKIPGRLVETKQGWRVESLDHPIPT